MWTPIEDNLEDMISVVITLSPEEQDAIIELTESGIVEDIIKDTAHELVEKRNIIDLNFEIEGYGKDGVELSLFNFVNVMEYLSILFNHLYDFEVDINELIEELTCYIDCSSNFELMGDYDITEFLNLFCKDNVYDLLKEDFDKIIKIITENITNTYYFGKEK